MPNFGGEAYKANPKARTAGASPYNSTTVQKPRVDTDGTFNPAMETENITAGSTKGMKANPGARTARGAKPY
tara:strand:- start:284 stop:499 length:216 start_codon:yes stop_codon:yes gene_type:complete